MFLQVGAGAMSAFDDLVVEERLVEFFHARGKLTGMDRADAIVLRRRKDERLGIVPIRLQLVVGRDRSEELALFGNGS